MNELRARFTLPELQEQLDNLAEGAVLQISGWDYERLFGVNDVAAARLRNFATLHACVASHAKSAILSRKRLTRRESDAPTFFSEV